MFPHAFVLGAKAKIVAPIFINFKTKIMNIRYKYLLVNLIWCAIFSSILNICFYLWIPEHVITMIKLEFVLLVVTSLISQVDLIHKNKLTLRNGIESMVETFFTGFIIIFSCILVIFLLHLLFDYQSIYWENYKKAILTALCFVTFYSRLSLHEDY
jgi:hypothetical protein